MTGQTVQFESSNIQNILIALVVICAIVYGFIEFRKINVRLQELEEDMFKYIKGLRETALSDYYFLIRFITLNDYCITN